MGQQVGEAGNRDPLGGRAGQSTIETAIEHEGRAQVVAQGPQVADGATVQKGLREMPYLAGDHEVLSNWMGNRECLSELGTANRSVRDFIEEIVSVVVKALHIRAGQQGH